MKFNEFKYERLDLSVTKQSFESLINKMDQAKSVDDFMDAYHEANKIRGHIMTMQALCQVRYTINTADEFYDAENTWWDQNSPEFTALNVNFYKAVLGSKYIEEIKEKIPSTFFMKAENCFKAFDEKLIPYMQKENQLTSEYDKLIAGAEIEFDGKINNLSQMGKYTLSADRSVREKAEQARLAFFEKNEAEFDRIYDELVKVRTQMAKEMGFDNFIELGYLRMDRLDYNAQDVENFRRQVREEIVPAATRLYERQKSRLGLDQLAFFDEKSEFLSGNPTPKGSYDEMIESALKMYNELSPETGEFFKKMVDQELLDLVAKPKKAAGGYMTPLYDFKMPFIFSNFNGTSGDVDVLTHEAGHAFQGYMSKDIEEVECLMATYEACEVHSMSMEFFAWPWMELFFKEDTKKYHFLHLSDALKFIPYGVLVDHFQHEVYAHPEMTPAERKATYHRLEEIYLPHKNYDGAPLLEKGCWWYRQSHIFQMPFYYIDYTLAQICAIQFWNRNYLKDENSWSDYLTLCKLGGTLPFQLMVKSANLKSPFEDGVVHEVIGNVESYLNAIDDTKL